jgi:Ser/Thr protein kinase RdoA (MazF antagonist)
MDAPQDAPQDDDDMQPGSGGAATHPFARLTPDLLLDALESAGWRGDGRLLALNSYENRVYQVWLEDGGVVVTKFYRPGRWSDAQILEEHAFTTELSAMEIPVVAPLPSPLHGASGTLLPHRDFRFAVYPRQGGHAPELEHADTLERIGRFIGRIHSAGAAGRFVERPALDPVTFGDEPRRWLADHAAIPMELVPAWRAVVDQALQAVDAAWERASPLKTIRLHGDCHPGNILWTDAGPHFVDFDDARSGPAIQDLWMLLSGDRQSMSRQLSGILTGYEDFAEVDGRELALVEPLRTLRLIHYSAWLASRWDDPAFPAAFPWFGSARYWEDRILELREQLAAMSEPPLVV